MAYVGKPFDHDIFVSYSHGDPDGTGDSKLRQWSQAFARELESELKTDPKLATTVNVFLDQDQRPHQGIDPLAPLTDQLRADIGGSAILTVLMSKQYLESTWCSNERGWWCEKQTSLGIPVKGRIAIVRVFPTNATWPAPLADDTGEPLFGFDFYDRANSGLAVRPYEWPAPLPTSRDPFRTEIVRLAGWVGLRLEEIKTRLDERRLAEENVARLGATTGQVVDLHGRAESAAAWDRAGDALSGSGFVVFPNEPDPVATDPAGVQRIRRQRVETMSGCDALLLVATDDGRAADADLVVVGHQDRNSARASSKRPLPCALLDGVGAMIATPKRRVAARSLNVQWIDATAEPWTPVVQQWLVDAARAEGTP